MIISNYSFEYSHFDATGSLHTWLQENNIPGIYGIDTRELTKTLRTTGVMLGKITTEPEEGVIDIIDPNETNLAGMVGVKEPVVYSPKKKNPKKILLIDCGVKNNIIRNFVNRGAEVIRIGRTRGEEHAVERTSAAARGGQLPHAVPDAASQRAGRLGADGPRGTAESESREGKNEESSGEHRAPPLG
jgi:carbamoylphosphate synthase small subunit